MRSVINTDGIDNTAVGFEALNNNTSGEATQPSVSALAQHHREGTRLSVVLCVKHQRGSNAAADRSAPIPPATTTRPSVLCAREYHTGSNNIALGFMPAATSPRPITSSASAQTSQVRIRTTAALSGIFSVRPLPEDLRF